MGAAGVQHLLHLLNLGRSRPPPCLTAVSCDVVVLPTNITCQRKSLPQRASSRARPQGQLATKIPGPNDKLELCRLKAELQKAPLRCLVAGAMSGNGDDTLTESLLLLPVLALWTPLEERHRCGHECQMWQCQRGSARGALAPSLGYGLTSPVRKANWALRF